MSIWMYSPSSDSSFFFGLGGIGVTAKPLLLVESLGREFPKEPRNLFPLAVLLSPLPHITNGYPPLKLTPPTAAPAEAGDILNACNCKPPPVAPTKTTEDANPAAAWTYAISAATFSNKQTPLCKIVEEPSCHKPWPYGEEEEDKILTTTKRCRERNWWEPIDRRVSFWSIRERTTLSWTWSPGLPGRCYGRSLRLERILHLLFQAHS